MAVGSCVQIPTSKAALVETAAQAVRNGLVYALVGCIAPFVKATRRPSNTEDISRSHTIY